MSICMVGVDHNLADINVRSVFSFTINKMRAFYAAVKQQPGVEGCVLLATCNRMELWLDLREKSEVDPFAFLCDFLDVRAEDYTRHVVSRSGKEAVHHLFRLAAGLESRIIGEDQIVTQVGDALAFSRSCYATDHTLEVLFRLAVTGAKRVKTETDLSTADRSVIHTALRCLTQEGITVAGKTCMVIGNGMMGRLSAETLMEQGAHVMVTIRQYHSGVVDVPAGCERINYTDRLGRIAECDFVVSATSSPNYTLTYRDLEQIHSSHPVTMIDLAVPRDIEPEAANLPWLDLYDIDSFRIDLESEKLRLNLKRAEEILGEEEDHFYEWYEGRDYVPRIQALKQCMGEDVVGRLTPVMRKMPLEEEAKEALRKEIAGASERMLNRVLFGLRTKLSDEMFRECLGSIEEIMRDK